MGVSCGWGAPIVFFARIIELGLTNISYECIVN